MFLFRVGVCVFFRSEFSLALLGLPLLTGPFILSLTHGIPRTSERQVVGLSICVFHFAGGCCWCRVIVVFLAVRLRLLHMVWVVLLPWR